MSEYEELTEKVRKALNVHRNTNNLDCFGCPYQGDKDCAESLKRDFRRALVLEIEEAEEGEE